MVTMGGFGQREFLNPSGPFGTSSLKEIVIGRQRTIRSDFYLGNTNSIITTEDLLHSLLTRKNGSEVESSDFLKKS